eukprot:6341673-Ditylum_brightwellii.AAC.1
MMCLGHSKVLFEKLHRRGGISMSTNDAEDLLRTEHIYILSQANENNWLCKKVSAVSVCVCHVATELLDLALIIFWNGKIQTVVTKIPYKMRLSA